jgi:Family of unknown function (DUF6072)
MGNSKRLARVGAVGSSLKNSVCSSMVKNISVLFVLNDEASMPNSGVVGNTIKLVGEIIVPGASLLVDGDIKTGVGHLVVGLVARALLGPLGLAVVNVNSFAQSVSDKSLFDHTAEILSSERLRLRSSSARSSADGGS